MSFATAPNFEAPTDGGINNVYDVQVKVSDGVLFDTQSILVTVTNVNEAPVTTPVTLAAIAEDSGARLITQAELLANASDVDNASLTALGLAIASGNGNGTLVDNANGTWSYTPALNDDTSVSFSYSVSDGSLTAAGSATLDLTPVNDAPVTTPVTLAAIAEDSGARLITQAELLANASDVDNASLTALGLAIASGNGTLVDNANGTWSYTPALNDDTSVSFSYSVSDGSLTAAGSATLDLTPVNDAPVTTPVTLAAIAEDSGARLITQAELLANASDVDNASLTALGLAIAAGGNGTLVDNANGTWSYTPALNDDTSVSFSYSVSDGSLTAAGSATLDLTPVNDAPVTTPVTLAAIAEDSGARLITQAELLANASDVDNASLTALGLAIAAGGNGTLVDNANGTWSYTPALNDDTSVSFSYSVSDGSLTAAGSATLDLTPVNDAPVTTPVTLAAIAEDSGARLITQAELLANASDVDNASLTALGLAIAAGGNGTLVDNANGTWSYTPALNDDTSVSFSYSVSDGSLTAAGSATLDLTPVNDAPVTTPVTLAAIAEDSGARLITQAELLANASDVDNASLTALGLAIAAGGNGTLVDNANGTWSYTPALNDDTSVSFSYSVSDGSLTAAGSATLDLTPVNDAPVTTPVTLAAIAEDSGARLITQAELLANASDVDNASLTALGLAIAAGGNGTLVDNANGTWSYTPALNDDTSVSFSYSVSDGSLTAAGSATLDLTPVNDAPVTTPVTLAAIAEDSGARLITQAELLANASDVDNASLTALGLAIAAGGNGTLVDNANGTWSYTPALNDDTSVSFSYSVSDGSLTAAGSATLDLTPVNDAPVTTPVTLAAIAEDSGARLITQAELLANASDVDNASLTALGLAIAAGGNGTLVDNANGTWSYTPALNDDTSVSFSYSVSDGSLTAAGSATLDLTPVNDAASDLIFSFTGAPGNSLPNGNFGQMSLVDPDGGALSYSYLLAALTATTLPGGVATGFAGDLSVSSTGVISASNLDDNRDYEMSIQVTQGTATFTETFSVITGTNAGETIGGVYANGDDVIFARGDADTILAGSGNDTVFGQSADDQIHGGIGNDVLTGGGGNDTFYFDTVLNGATNVDKIVDFATGNDHISLLKAGLFANLTGIAGATTLGSDFNTAAQTGGHIVYDATAGNLYYDADGGSHTLSGAGTDSVLFASLIGNPRLRLPTSSSADESVPVPEPAGSVRYPCRPCTRHFSA
ncbi:cadherin-like domain-containing protein [Polaromonas sp. P2-4]|nr:cadherin-like domain-containing protein [Polaromonas sp. P2-4]